MENLTTFLTTLNVSAAIKSKVKPWSQDWLMLLEFIPVSVAWKRLGVFLLPLDGILIHCRSLPRNLLGFPNNSPVPIYTPGRREALWESSVWPKNTTQCPRTGLEPGRYTPGMNALTIRPLHLEKKSKVIELKSCIEHLFSMLSFCVHHLVNIILYTQSLVFKVLQWIGDKNLFPGISKNGDRLNKI